MLAPLPPGTPRRIGPHTLLARIGAGGMGEVFLARRDGQGDRDGQPGRAGQGASALVAVKVVRQDLDLDDAFRARFRREIAAARAVTGPFTAALVDADADAERPWLATEYIAGPSLADVVERCGPLPVPAVRALGAALARALTAVHGARVLHRDLKPGNVLLAPDGPRLIDFGIAQAFEATALTMTGVLVGTPGFLAPEQIEGSHAVVPASDVFSLGAVLCHAATGRGPFDDPEAAAVIFRIVRGDADLSDVPPELRDTLAACLHPTPEERPTPEALATTLSAPDDGTPPSPSPSPSSAPFPWPADVLSLFAEYREAVTASERAHGQGGFADAATTAGSSGPRLRAEPSPTLGGVPAPPPVEPPTATTPRRDRRRLWVLAAALTTAGLAVAAVTLPDALRDRPGDDPSKKPPSAPRAVADRVVTAYGNQDHSGEFGPSAADRAKRPDDWRFWSRERSRGMDGMGKGCVLTGDTLVCRDGRGAARALNAATGADRWSTPGFSAAPSGFQEVPPEADAKRVFVPSERGVSALGVKRGEVIWRHKAPRYAGLIAMTHAEGVVYTAEFNLDGAPDPYTSTVRARNAVTGDELWRTTIEGKTQGTPLVRDGVLYTALENGGVVALSTKDGERTARVAKPRCDSLLGHRDAVVCWSRTEDGVRVLDGDTLAVRRTIGEGKPLAPPVVGSADVLVISHSPRPRTPNRLTGYAWRSGKRLWDVMAGGDATELALSKDRVFVVNSHDVRGVPLDGDAERVTTWSIPYSATGPEPKTLYTPLFLGGTVFAESGKGPIVSGRVL
ncbi:protein kinase domain-containing protein [Streptomyces sp. RK9]|uniref:protein kinase domain-containing protein n=1 Tax=Streptomyces sp. RK9 TaxID=3239284 RepID=UPI00386FB131